MELFIYENEQNLFPPTELETEIERLREELRIERERHLYTVAGFRNYCRRLERKNLMLESEHKQEITIPLYDIINCLDNTLRRIENSEQPFLNDVLNIYLKLLSLSEIISGPPEHVSISKYEGSKPALLMRVVSQSFIWGNAY
jgi:molecular chaperone GrpE (heat shock protein)